MSGRGRKPTGLSDEDAEIWDEVSKTIHPLRKRVTTPMVADAQPASATESPASQSPAAEPTIRAKRRWQPLVTSPPPRPLPAPVPVGLDRRQVKKIARGHIGIDGRIDLHGLTENEAHHRLRSYLHHAQAQGKRMVLVITGKGRDDDDVTTPYGVDRSRRGVLKRNVPRWLASSELSEVVVSFGPAHTRHGGDGALYVHIRQRR